MDAKPNPYLTHNFPHTKDTQPESAYIQETCPCGGATFLSAYTVKQSRQSSIDLYGPEGLKPFSYISSHWTWFYTHSVKMHGKMYVYVWNKYVSLLKYTQNLRCQTKSNRPLKTWPIHMSGLESRLLRKSTYSTIRLNAHLHCTHTKKQAFMLLHSHTD